MGRASNRKKRRRAEPMSSPFPELARYERASALAVLAAASVSPAAAHRQPSISVATAALHQRRRDGHTTVTPDYLPQLLAAGAKGLRYGGLEADEPLDPRLDVRARWGNELFRLAPGGWERPISIVQQVKLASRALDPTLDQRLGFRLRDLAELALRHMDEVLAPLSEQWPQGDTNLGVVWEREAFVIPGEVAAAREVPTIGSTATRCSDPPRAARALRWASCSPNELIKKRYDVRVTVIGDDAFAARIQSQRSSYGRVDWRRGEPARLHHEIEQLPEEVEQRCVDLVKRYGLQFGAIDLAVDLDGQYVFFELNPNGQWAWIEQVTGLPLRSRLADLLQHGCSGD